MKITSTFSIRENNLHMLTFVPVWMKVSICIKHIVDKNQVSKEISRPLRDGDSDSELFSTQIVCLTAHRLVQ